jgi:mannose/cellobiose epimerase-like protein (N-acyl-D-glucosamine 2-epimerase family)
LAVEGVTLLDRLSAESRRLTALLDEHALPLWLEVGLLPGKGFVETVDQTGRPTQDPVRSRVNPRQVYCFARAGLRGWQGDWQTAVDAGLARFETVYRRSDGFYADLASLDGELLKPAFDLYNQAFALLAFAATAEAMPDRRAAMEGAARTLLDRLRADYAHPVAGFQEARPPKTPLRSNPHMHLFEAAQAWAEVPGADTEPWLGLARELRDLCLSRFIDGGTGVLREFFDGDWDPHPGELGRVVEPGHLFEWAWLLARFEYRHTGAAGEVTNSARRLFALGERHGVDETRGVAVMTLDDAMHLVDRTARLWVQTEWLKAAILLARLSEGDERQRYMASALRACRALQGFLDTPIAGLWWDKQDAQGHFREELAPASSFYHIVCAIHEFADQLEAMRR